LPHRFSPCHLQIHFLHNAAQITFSSGQLQSLIHRLTPLPLLLPVCATAISGSRRQRSFPCWTNSRLFFILPTSKNGKKTVLGLTGTVFSGENMTISDRYRQIVADLEACQTLLVSGSEDFSVESSIVAGAATQLHELLDQVGEIPRIRLETQLTPVLLKAHSQLDRARLLLEEREQDEASDAVWDLQQAIYRLLNDL
jgi:hypothetical protein